MERLLLRLNTSQSLASSVLPPTEVLEDAVPQNPPVRPLTNTASTDPSHFPPPLSEKARGKQRADPVDVDAWRVSTAKSLESEAPLPAGGSLGVNVALRPQGHIEAGALDQSDQVSMKLRVLLECV